MKRQTDLDVLDDSGQWQLVAKVREFGDACLLAAAAAEKTGREYRARETHPSGGSVEYIGRRKEA